MSTPLSDVQFSALADARKAAKNALSRASAAQQRHPGPLGQMAFTEAQRAFSDAHNRYMRAYDDRYWAERQPTV